jgi:hypothetical protein
MSIKMMAIKPLLMFFFFFFGLVLGKGLTFDFGGWWVLEGGRFFKYRYLSDLILAWFIGIFVSSAAVLLFSFSISHFSVSKMQRRSFSLKKKKFYCRN